MYSDMFEDNILAKYANVYEDITGKRNGNSY
jgi:hypothetical protein